MSMCGVFLCTFVENNIMTSNDYRGRQDLPRPIRDNDPGDIRNSSEFQGYVGSDGSFDEFDNMAYGIRAFWMILHTYRTRYGLNTLRKCISRYAPPNENNTIGYMQAVSDGTGIGLDDELPTDAATWVKITKVWFVEEAGKEADTYITDTDYAVALEMFEAAEPGYLTMP